MRTLLLLLALASACKKSEKSVPATPPSEAAKPTTPPAGSGAAPGSAAPVDNSGAAALPSDGKLGCFAWSLTSKAAACITGRIGSSDAKLALSLVGTGLVSSLGAKVEASAAGTANQALLQGSYIPFSGDAATTVPVANATPAGGNVTITAKPAEVAASCGGKTVTLYKVDGDDDRTFTATLRKLGAHALVEVHSKAEAEQRLDVALLELATCQVSTSD